VPAPNSIRDWLAATCGSDLDWTTVETLVLAFNLSTVAVGPQAGGGAAADCFQLAVRLTLDNRDHDGQVLLGLDLQPRRLDCPSAADGLDGGLCSLSILFLLALNAVVMAVCVASLLLCLRALLRAQLLRHETETFLAARRGWSLTVSERLDFLNLWYVMICVNDLLIILATLAKLVIELRLAGAGGDLWDVTSLLLGTGCLLVWFGLLRYLGFFRTYNVLILTMKESR
jgi:mucolipin